MRKSRMITDKKEIESFINLTQDDITTSFIIKTFGEFGGKSKYNPYDLIEIPANSYGPEGKKNKNSFVTGLGLFIFNKYFIEEELFDLFQYISETIDGGLFGKMNKTMTYALIEDKITLKTMKRYLMKTQKVMPYVSVLSPSYSLKMETCTPLIEKKKNELFKKYEKELAGPNNEIYAEIIESELKDFAKEYLKGDPAMDTYDSGARGSFGNNFKNMYIMKGAIKDPDPNKGFVVAKSNYMDGVSKEEYATFAKSLVAGPYSRGKKTEIGGYWEKLFVQGLQHVTLDDAGSDCGSTTYLEVTLNKSNIDDFMYSYIVKGSQLIELTSDLRDEYIGKTVKMRFSLFCKSKTGYCNKCAGNLFYRIGDIKNIGVSEAVIPSKLKNLSMKSFHDSTVKTSEMDPMKAFSLV